jgi:hypothetical protein
MSLSASMLQRKIFSQLRESPRLRTPFCSSEQKKEKRRPGGTRRLELAPEA